MRSWVRHARFPENNSDGYISSKCNFEVLDAFSFQDIHPGDRKRSTLQQVRDNFPDSICNEYLGYIYIVGQNRTPGITWSIPDRGHGGYYSKGAWYIDLDLNPKQDVKELYDLAEKSVRTFIDKLVVDLAEFCKEES